MYPRLEAERKLKEHIEKGRDISKRIIDTEEVLHQSEDDGTKWQEYTIRLLTALFDSNSLSNEYQGNTVDFNWDTPTLEESRDLFLSRMKSRIKHLESVLESLDLYAESPVIAAKQEKDAQIKNPRTLALENIERITKRFQVVARQLLHRHNNGATIKVENEFDAQDLFHALLRLFFDDIRAEEWTPSYAGGHSRMDFLLKYEQIVIEIKMTRLDLRARDIGDQLINDIDRYRNHPDCKVLIAFVYDPEGYIGNPKGLEHDLSKNIDGLFVKVIITPS